MPPSNKALLRYHDEANWPQLRAALSDMGRDDLIGSGADCLVPAASGKPSTRISDMKRPICLGGKFTTAATWRPTSSSKR